MQLTLSTARERYSGDDELELTGRYTNDSEAPIALAFWWNRTLRVVDAAGAVVVANPGPVLPCGVGEMLEVIAAGATFERHESVGCTQPAGRSEKIGWSYALAPGTYSITLMFESPPAHGFTQHTADPREFRGRVESNPVTVTITSMKTRKKWFGLF